MHPYPNRNHEQDVCEAYVRRMRGVTTDAEHMGGVGAMDAERLSPKRDSGEVM